MKHKYLEMKWENGLFVVKRNMTGVPIAQHLVNFRFLGSASARA